MLRCLTLPSASWPAPANAGALAAFREYDARGFSPSGADVERPRDFLVGEAQRSRCVSRLSSAAAEEALLASASPKLSDAICVSSRAASRGEQCNSPRTAPPPPVRRCWRCDGHSRNPGHGAGHDLAVDIGNRQGDDLGLRQARMQLTRKLQSIPHRDVEDDCIRHLSFEKFPKRWSNVRRIHHVERAMSVKFATAPRDRVERRS
jgi:hypothetical protein